MPMMAHKQHGFMSVNSDISEMIKAGWVVCDDVMKFKREVLGIGGQVVEIPKEPATIVEQPKVRRAGRPRKEVPSILNDGGDDGNSADDN